MYIYCEMFSRVRYGHRCSSVIAFQPYTVRTCLAPPDSRSAPSSYSRTYTRTSYRSCFGFILSLLLLLILLLLFCRIRLLSFSSRSVYASGFSSALQLLLVFGRDVPPAGLCSSVVQVALLPAICSRWHGVKWW
jgi:hypothetical protein